MNKIITQNFDWAETKIPLTIFIPNRGRGNFIRELFHQFKTDIKDNYLIIIGNDGYEERFDDLPNTKYFTIHRASGSDRNGCFIRNYFIKRCQSENIFQKDPETELFPKIGYDWIKEYSEVRHRIIRPSETMAIDEDIDFQPVLTSISHRVHWGFLCPTYMLQDIRGYDEKYTNYGYEDTDIYERLIFCYGRPFLDDRMIVAHHPHPVNPSIYNQVNEMAKIFAYRNRSQCVRNVNGWGEG